jgi:hypothetical protein
VKELVCSLTLSDHSCLTVSPADVSDYVIQSSYIYFVINVGTQSLVVLLKLQIWFCAVAQYFH